MKTPNEIKRELVTCTELVMPADVQHAAMVDALAYIQQLERENAQKDERILRLEQRAPRWISVEERLPDESEGLVLIVASGGHKNICFDNALLLGTYYDDSGWIVEGYVDWEDARVTHWMPLPEPPEEGEK